MMTQVIIQPIVEGHAETSAVPKLLHLLWKHFRCGGQLIVLPPIRQPRQRIVKEDVLRKAVMLARNKLHQCRSELAYRAVLLLLDADNDCPATLAPDLKHWLMRHARDVHHMVVLANIDYETWLIAASANLEHDLLPDTQIPQTPEQSRCGKGWLKAHWNRVKYSEVIDQPRLTSAIDVNRGEHRSASFAKLCREVLQLRQ